MKFMPLARMKELPSLEQNSVQVKGFIITGVLQLAGAMMMAHLGSATLRWCRLRPDVIAAVVIGGTALSGGVGPLWELFSVLL